MRRAPRILALLAFAAGLWGWSQSRPQRVGPARWTGEGPALARPGDRFRVRVLELDEQGVPKDAGQWRRALEAARKADDAFLFLHGWRNDASATGSMEAFLDIYRQAFACLATKDVEGTAACAATHGYCHPPSPDAKLVVLVLWDARSGLLGFRATQARAQSMGEGLLSLMRQIRGAQPREGTFLAFAHSLGATALSTALHRASEEGGLPLDGALLVMGAFDVDPLGATTAGAQGPGSDLVLLNLFNPKDGYLRLYERVYGTMAAGARGLAGVPVSDGAKWGAEGASCGGGSTSVSASLLDEARPLRLSHGATVEALNLDVSALVKGHQDTEALPAIRLYNRAVAEALFRVLWKHLMAPESSHPAPGGD